MNCSLQPDSLFWFGRHGFQSGQKDDKGNEEKIERDHRGEPPVVHGHEESQPKNEIGD